MQLNPFPFFISNSRRNAPAAGDILITLPLPLSLSLRLLRHRHQRILARSQGNLSILIPADEDEQPCPQELQVTDQQQQPQPPHNRCASQLQQQQQPQAPSLASRPSVHRTNQSLVAPAVTPAARVHQYNSRNNINHNHINNSGSRGVDSLLETITIQRTKSNPHLNRIGNRDFFPQVDRYDKLRSSSCSSGSDTETGGHRNGGGITGDGKSGLVDREEMRQTDGDEEEDEEEEEEVHLSSLIGRQRIKTSLIAQWESKIQQP